ncbi:MAG TPA: hypothetical protein PK239_13680 [Chitinophagales bacterium]|nr:hypothetical protein [Chitinophagales bacterium]
MKKILFLLLGLSIFSGAFAQPSGKSDPPPPYNAEVMRQHEDSLIALFDNVRKLPKEQDRFNACYTFVPALVKALKEPGAYYYPFDSLRKWVSIVKPTDDAFRIFTWMVAKGNADDYRTISYRYFGAIQMNNPDKLVLFPLEDKSRQLTSIEDKELTNDQWMGSLYYDVHEYTQNNTKYYMLFGWDGNNFRSDKKIADLLFFRNDKPKFGAPVFEVINPQTKQKAIKHRLILEFKEGSAVTLKFNKEENKIVYDFLAPEDEKANQIGGAAFALVPDGTYQGLELNTQTGVWEARPMVLKGISMEAPPRPSPLFDKGKQPSKGKMVAPVPGSNSSKPPKKKSEK